MTQYSDQLRQGNAYLEREGSWNAPTVLSGLPTASSPSDTEVRGVPHTQQFCYQIGTASSSLASGYFYASSLASGSITATGALVTASVGTFDVPRAIRITASGDRSTTSFTFIGTDGYGQTLKTTLAGPTGNTIGNTGSYVDTLTTWKTITSASQSGAATGPLYIGTSNTFGLPYVLTNKGMGLDMYIDGASATVPAVVTITATAVPTATTGDVRGTVAVATTILPNDSRYFTFVMITPNVNTTVNTDTRTNSFGAVPFGG